MQKNKVILYTDGGARGNPGPAGIGVYIETLEKRYKKYIGERTNNEAEYEALIFGLQKVKSLLGSAKAKETDVLVYMDSELVVRQLTGEYKIKEQKLQPLFIEVWNAKLDFASVDFEHVRREKNEQADALVNEILDAQEGGGLFD